MRRPTLLVKLAACLPLAASAAAAQAPAAAEAPAVQMAPYRAADTSLFFGYSLYVRWSPLTLLIYSIRFTDIKPGSLAEKAGLRVGDHLLAVDGKSVLGIRQEEFTAIMTRTSVAGETIAYAFTIERGLFRRQMTLVMRIRLLPANAPEQGPPPVAPPSS
jgi:membrane-associated protease RseP (regulator of RpoE activity)